jgi:hypothetical protein
MTRKNIFWLRWMRDYSLGEILAIGASTTLARLLLFNYSELSGSMYSALVIVILITAGILEGIIIGYFQHKSLIKLIPGFKKNRWIAWTCASTVIGWLLILPPSLLLIAVLSRMSVINNMETIFFVSLVGSLFGALISIPQFFLLNRYFKSPLGWILVNILGWSITFLTIYFSISIMSHKLSWIEKVVAFASSCIISGIVQGLITVTFLRFMAQERVANRLEIK